MPRKKKLIDLYKEWMETEDLSGDGLCSSLPKHYLESFEHFSPSQQEIHELGNQMFSTLYWGSGLKCYDHIDLRARKFTPLRQTIVLLICAMHDEL